MHAIRGCIDVVWYLYVCVFARARLHYCGHYLWPRIYLSVPLNVLAIFHRGHLRYWTFLVLGLPHCLPVFLCLLQAGV